jgi:hypothetical protein
VTALAVETGLETTACHFPPGTPKWNKIEHRLFSHITMNWHGDWNYTPHPREHGDWEHGARPGRRAQPVSAPAPL